MGCELPDGYTVRALTHAEAYKVGVFVGKFRGENIDERKIIAELYAGLAGGAMLVLMAFHHGVPVACGIVYGPSGANRCAHIFQAYAEPGVPAAVTAHAFEEMRAWAKMMGARGLTAATRRKEVRAFYERYDLRPVGVILEQLFEEEERNDG